MSVKKGSVEQDALLASINQALDALLDPFTQSAFTAGRALKSVDVDEQTVSIKLRKGYPLENVADQLVELVHQALAELAIGERTVQVDLQQEIVSHSVQQGVKAISGIKNIIAVASGKGGVGKSTVSVNIATALQMAGASVALLDADIYGPSQPRMLGITAKPDTLDDKRLVPLDYNGMKVMSIGFMVEEDTPMIWRGPMVTQALEQMLRGTAWDADEQEIDYLIIDLPPGTGDIQLTLSQRVPVTGALIVTTPQDIALLDARKAFNMFDKVEVPVLGVIENMSTHICSNCGHEEAIFGTDGAEQMAQQYDLQLLGKIPLQKQIREYSDEGAPIVFAQANSSTAQIFSQIALGCVARLSVKRKNFSDRFPNIVVENS